MRRRPFGPPYVHLAQALAVLLAMVCVLLPGMRMALAGEGGALRVAVVVTRDSPFQPAGEVPGAAIEDAARLLNGSGGVLGRPVDVKVFADACSARSAVTVAQSVIAAKPMVVIGHLCAGAALAAAPLYSKAQIVFMTPGVRDPRLTMGEQGGLVFRVAGREDQFAADTVHLITALFGAARIAVVGDRTLQARALVKDLAQTLTQGGGTVVAKVLIESGEVSYDRTARKIAEAKPDVVVMPAQPVELGVLVDGLRRLGVKAPIIGSEILAVPAILPVARREQGNLVLMLPWSGLAAGDGATAGNRNGLAGSISARAIGLRSRAAFEAWAQACVTAGTVEARAVADALRTNRVQTSVGLLGFDAAGDARVPSYVGYSFREGEWRPVPVKPEGRR
ncbi:MAG: branched-chain amino acid ABC transporter substrate-binding protein [Hyphomicrobiaceae bacterium]